MQSDHKHVLVISNPRTGESPVGDVLHVADGVVGAALLGAQDDGVEVPVDHGGAQTLELRHKPDAAQHHHRLALHPTNTHTAPKTGQSASSRQNP